MEKCTDALAQPTRRGEALNTTKAECTGLLLSVKNDLSEPPSEIAEAADVQGAACSSHAVPREPVPRAMVQIRPVNQESWLNCSELWQYRDLLFSLASRDLKLRYRQTALGVFWVVFQPLAGAGIFAVVFGWVAGLGTSKTSYFLFSLAGLLVWNVFQSTLAKSSTALIGNAALVSKVYFPRLLLPLSTVLSSLVDFSIGLLVFFVAAAVLKAKISWLGVMLLPVWLAGALGAAVGLGLLCAAVMTRYRDVQHILPVLLPFLMYASPVAYALEAVPAQWKLLFYWNPMSWILEGARASLLATGSVEAPWAAYAIGCCGLTLFLGLMGFKKMERSFADVL